MQFFRTIMCLALGLVKTMCPFLKKITYDAHCPLKTRESCPSSSSLRINFKISSLNLLQVLSSLKPKWISPWCWFNVLQKLAEENERFTTCETRISKWQCMKTQRIEMTHQFLIRIFPFFSYTKETLVTLDELNDFSFSLLLDIALFRWGDL